MYVDSRFGNVDLDQVRLGGRAVREWPREDLERELLRLGVPVAPGSGRDFMGFVYGAWLKEVQEGKREAPAEEVKKSDLKMVRM
jgi:hypothetical protein